MKGSFDWIERRFIVGFKLGFFENGNLGVEVDKDKAGEKNRLARNEGGGCSAFHFRINIISTYVFLFACNFSYINHITSHHTT